MLIVVSHMSFSECLRAIGLMSGTSMDGIDAALITTDGEIVKSHGASYFLAYSEETKRLIRQAIITERPHSRLEQHLTTLHALAVIRLLKKAKLHPKSIDVIGFHGQTIVHKPEQHYTLQIGDGPQLAKLLKIPVIYNFRSADVEAGGQGAPLVPVYHRAITASAPHPLAVVNIGGVANMTWIGEDYTVCAFDTGPGNALINDSMKRLFGLDYDPQGSYAAKGSANEHILSQLLSHPYFSSPPPKSLDRNSFATLVSIVAKLSPYDQIATLTAFTAKSILGAAKLTPNEPKAWLICGGGRHNHTLFGMLNDNLKENSIKPIDYMSLNGDMIEAYAFGFLAVRSLRKLPLTYPETTGVKTPMLGGVFCPVLLS